MREAIILILAGILTGQSAFSTTLKGGSSYDFSGTLDCKELGVDEAIPLANMNSPDIQTASGSKISVCDKSQTTANVSELAPTFYTIQDRIWVEHVVKTLDATLDARRAQYEGDSKNPEKLNSMKADLMKLAWVQAQSEKYFSELRIKEAEEQKKSNQCNVEDCRTDFEAIKSEITQKESALEAFTKSMRTGLLWDTSFDDLIGKLKKDLRTTDIKEVPQFPASLEKEFTKTSQKAFSHMIESIDATKKDLKEKLTDKEVASRKDNQLALQFRNELHKNTALLKFLVDAAQPATYGDGEKGRLLREAHCRFLKEYLAAAQARDFQKDMVNWWVPGAGVVVSRVAGPAGRVAATASDDFITMITGRVKKAWDFVNSARVQGLQLATIDIPAAKTFLTEAKDQESTCNRLNALYLQDTENKERQQNLNDCYSSLEHERAMGYLGLLGTAVTGAVAARGLKPAFTALKDAAEGVHESLNVERSGLLAQNVSIMTKAEKTEADVAMSQLEAAVDAKNNPSAKDLVRRFYYKVKGNVEKTVADAKQQREKIREEMQRVCSVCGGCPAAAKAAYNKWETPDFGIIGWDPKLALSCTKRSG